MKRTTVIIRKSPFNTVRNSEAVRMSLGLTLRESPVRVVFLDDGVYLTAKTNPEAVGSLNIKQHVDMLRDLGHELIAEKESLEERGIDNFEYPVTVLPRNEIAKIIAQSDITIVY